MEKTNFKGTKGKWAYCPSEVDKSRNFAVLIEGSGSMIADIYLKTKWDDDSGLSKHPEISEFNAKLIVEAGNVRQQINCSLTELLEQRNELLEALENILHNDIVGCNSEDDAHIKVYLYDLNEAQKAIERATDGKQKPCQS